MNRRGHVGYVALAAAVVCIGFDGVAADEAELLQKLSAIGYVAGSDSVEGPSGVTIYDIAAAHAGSNLMTRQTSQTDQLFSRKILKFST